jgi:hypothetical protein
MPTSGNPRRMVKLKLDLPIEVIAYIHNTAKLANTSFDTVIAVLLAMAIQSRKVAETAVVTSNAAPAAKKKGRVK